jgi:hypothetical protein
MYHSPFQARAVLHRGIHAFGKLAPVPLAASAAGHQHPVFSDFVMRGRQIEHLPRLSHPRFRQRQTACIAGSRRCMENNVIRKFGLLEGMPLMPLLAARWVLAGRPQ